MQLSLFDSNALRVMVVGELQCMDAKDVASHREAAAAEAAEPQLPKLKQGTPPAVKRVAAADQQLFSEWEQGGKLQQVARPWRA